MEWTLCDGVSLFLPRPLGLFLRRGFPASLSEHWRSNTYSLRHTNGNQLGGNCSIWPLSCLHHIPSSLCPYIIRTWTVKMNQRQSIHFIHLASPPAPKLNKTPVIYFISPDKIRSGGPSTNRKKRSERVWTEGTKAGKVYSELKQNGFTGAFCCGC